MLVGYRHQRQDLLDAAVELALSDGLSTLTFGGVAEHLGINDRTVVYYFPSKRDLVTDVVLALDVVLRALVGDAVGHEPLPAEALLQRVWPVLASTASDPLTAALLELSGLAAAGHQPYADLAPGLVAGWVDRLVGQIVPSAPTSARPEASAALAQLSGLVTLRHLSGARAANSAARHLGVIATAPVGRTGRRA